MDRHPMSGKMDIQKQLNVPLEAGQLLGVLAGGGARNPVDRFPVRREAADDEHLRSVG